MELQYEGLGRAGVGEGCKAGLMGKHVRAHARRAFLEVPGPRLLLIYSRRPGCGFPYHLNPNLQPSHKSFVPNYMGNWL